MANIKCYKTVNYRSKQFCLSYLFNTSIMLALVENVILQNKKNGLLIIFKYTQYKSNMIYKFNFSRLYFKKISI